MRNINYFDKELSVEEYVKKEVCKNAGTQSVAFKEQLISLCSSAGIECNEKMKKEELFDLLCNNGFEYKQFADLFGIGVSSQVYQSAFNITHQDVKCLERKSKDFRGMDDNVAYKNKQIDNVEISNEGRRALREKLREVKPKVEEPIGYELTIQDTNEVEWEHYTSMREYSGLTLKDGKYNLEDVMKSMMDAYETRYNYIVKEHENGERRISYDLTRVWRTPS